MEAERYVVRELEGYNITQGTTGSPPFPTLEVCVLDARHNYRIVQAFRSEELRTIGAGQGRGRPPRTRARALVRTQAAELAARLNEVTP